MIKRLREIIDCVYSFEGAYVTMYRFHDTIGDVLVQYTIGKHAYFIAILFRPDSFEIKHPGGMTAPCTYNQLHDTFKLALDSCTTDYDEDAYFRKELDYDTIMNSVDAVNFILPIFKKYTSKKIGISYEANMGKDIAVSIPRTSSPFIDFEAMFAMSNPNYTWFWYSHSLSMLYHSLNNNRESCNYAVNVSKYLVQGEELIQKRLEFDRKVELARDYQSIQEF